MKKLLTKIAIIAAVSFAASNVNAQVYESGANQLNIGIGLGSTFTGAGYKTSVPPLGVSFEHGLKGSSSSPWLGKVSVGGYLGYSSATFASFGGDWTYSFIIFGARGSYHFDFLDTDKFDPYAGIMIGYNAASVSEPSGYTGPSINASVGGLLIGGHAGLRYHFNEKFGAFGELGYGIAYLQLGVTTKF